MYKLLNMCDFSSLDEISENMEYYKDRYNFDGFEMIKFTDKNLISLKDSIKGYHLRFFPCWVDLYRENYKKLYSELETEENIRDLCGGTTKKELMEYYEKELERASELEAEYIVFHPCNIYIKESMHYNFEYSNMEVLQEVVNFINELFKGRKFKFTLLLENLWWPGLRLDNYEEADYLMKNINYSPKGFLLDTGHMLNNNLDLKSSEAGISYIKDNLKKLGEYKNKIYAVHLNFSMSGEYVKRECIKHNNITLDEAMGKVYPHISKIDSHQAFENDKIVEVLNELPLKYVIYEFISTDKEDLNRKIEIQDNCIAGL